MSSNTPALFQPVKIGALTLQHRIVHAPLTRFRNTKDNVPQTVMTEYYSQRAGIPGTLIIAESTFIAQKAGLYYNAPGIWNDAQIAGWKEITDAIHSKGSVVYLQLWALGRSADVEALHAADPKYPFVSASDLPLSPDAEIKPRPLSKDEIQEYVSLYSTATSNAVNKAGFDGVEILCSSGYLLDQFLQDMSNNRTDEYGGSVENRCRFPLEVTQGIVKAIGEERTGVRVSPWSPYQGMGMKDPVPTFSYFVSRLKALYPKLAFLHAVEPGASGGDYADVTPSMSNEFIRDIWLPRLLITTGRYQRDTALKAAEKALSRVKDAGQAADVVGELIGFGRNFLANPDLPARYKLDLPLNKYDRGSFYLHGDTTGKGFTDYPSYSDKLDV